MFRPVSLASRATAAGIAALSGALVGLPEAAAQDGENALSVSLGYATFSVPDRDPEGAALGIDFERAVTDHLWWRISGGGGFYLESIDGDLERSLSGQASLGLTYIIDDTLKYLPYVNLGLGGILVGGGPVDTEIRGLVEIGLGLDVLTSRSFSYGVLLRFATLFDDMSFFAGGVRATWRWGFF